MFLYMINIYYIYVLYYYQIRQRWGESQNLKNFSESFRN